MSSDTETASESRTRAERFAEEASVSVRTELRRRMVDVKAAEALGGALCGFGEYEMSDVVVEARERICQALVAIAERLGQRWAPPRS